MSSENVIMAPATALERELGIRHVASAVPREVVAKLAMPATEQGQISSDAEDGVFELPEAAAKAASIPDSALEFSASGEVAKPEAFAPLGIKYAGEGSLVTLQDAKAGITVTFRTPSVTIDKDERSVGVILPLDVLDLRLRVDSAYILTYQQDKLDVVYVGGRVKLSPSSVVLPFVIAATPQSDAN